MSEFMTLVDTSYAKVFYHSLKQVKNDHDAADITQNTFFKALMHFSTLREPSSYEPWLFTICNNEIKQFYRNTKKVALLHEDEPQDYVPPESQDDKDYDTLYDAIGHLSDVQRQAVLLKYFGGYTMQELAIILSISPVTIKSRLYEARKTLKRLLDTPAFSPSLQKERRNALMATLNLCAVGAQTIPCLSLHAQKQLLQCAKDNTKFNPAILAELANIPTGQAFMEACSGKLSYEELLRILACCDDATLYRIGGSTFTTWRNAVGSPLVRDIAALCKTGGYIDSVEPFLYVPSVRDTCEWYQKHLNWYSGDIEENEKWNHAAICPYHLEGDQKSYQQFKGFHINGPCEQGYTGTAANCHLGFFVSGLEDLRATIASSGWDKISEISHNAWGTKSFSLTDLNGFVLMFYEWECA